MKKKTMAKKKINIKIISPRGFCAGVNRAIKILEVAIEKYGVPIYVNHEIIHNKIVVDNFKSQGVQFIEDINTIPDGSVLIFSAHGTPKSLEEQAKQKNLTVIDGTCPLVHKIHKQAQKLEGLKHNIILIGHTDHQEVKGIIGRVDAHVHLITCLDDIKDLSIDNDGPIGIITQTTISVDDSKVITDEILKKYPHAKPESSICYATQNRQSAVKSALDSIDMLIVVGSENSSNSQRLCEQARVVGIKSILINTKDELPLEEIEHNYSNIGITSGASGPEFLTQGIIQKLQESFNASLSDIVYTKENVEFMLPKILRDKKNKQ